MTFSEMTEKRFSVRSYDTKPVEDEKLQRILEVAKRAPTAKNKQSPRLYVLKSAEAVGKIRKLTPCTYGAPVVLLLTYNKDEAFVYPRQEEQNSGDEDCSIVATHIMYAALEEGLGTCWVNFFNPGEVKEAFAIPDSEVPVLLMDLGYPSAHAHPAHKPEDKKPLADVVKVL